MLAVTVLIKMVPSEKFETYTSMWFNTKYVFLYLCQRYTVFHLLIKMKNVKTFAIKVLTQVRFSVLNTTPPPLKKEKKT